MKLLMIIMIRFKNIFDMIVVHVISAKIKAAEFKNINFYSYISHDREADQTITHTE